MHPVKEDIQEQGFSIIPHFFAEDKISEMIKHLDSHNALSYNEQTITDFNLIKSIPFINSLANAEQLTLLVAQVLGAQAFPLNAFILDKTQDNNWGLDWHQDLKIAVKTKIETPGYTNWTLESGITHVVPPLEVLEKRLSVRIHLDDCRIENGAMLVAPESHKQGIFRDKIAIESFVATKTLYAEVERGGVMLFSPLLLHKSPYSTSNRKRRILQIDYVGTHLSNGLEWYN